MPAPRILIVDDQRDITRMLRSALETLGKGYVIVDVPSAEEALLEMRRGLVDLLITDLRLPGISGIELIQRLRKASIGASMIVISAYADEKAQAEITGLGAAFYAKPLSLVAFLQGVQHALAGRAPADTGELEPPADPSAGIHDRLARLRRDLGAEAVWLIDRTGDAAVRAEAASPPALELTLPALAAALNAARDVGAALGGPGAGGVHFFDGRDYDLYAATVDAGLALVIVFAGERGAGQIGTVLRYSRQAAADVQDHLNRLGFDSGPVTASTLRAQGSPRPGVTTPSVSSTAKTGPLPQLPLSVEELAALDAAARQAATQDAASFWDSPADDIGDHRDGTLSFDQAAKLGLIDQEGQP
jgi:CheY-like chemotaxis protein